MIKAIVTDLSRVVVKPKDTTYTGSLNALHDELLKSGDYDFWQYFELNKELLKFYIKLKEKIKLYIFTSKYIQEYPPLKEKLVRVFDRILSASRLDIKKSNPESYKQIAKEINLEPDEILYIDDNDENIKAAQEAGLTTIHYQSNDALIEEINSQF